MISFDKKDIFDIKLAVTTDCFFDCKYCFVKKDKRTMDLAVAKKALDLTMFRPPDDKIVRIYGGEPLMCFELVEKIAEYARRLEKKWNKKLTLTLCTNGFLLKEKHLNVLKKYRFRYAISIDGEKKIHDKYRKLKNNEHGVYETVRKNIQLALEKCGKKNIAAGLGVTPSAVGQLEKSFKHLVNLGFDTVNVEPIHGFLEWDKQSQKKFLEKMNGIVDFIISEMKKGNFIFLTTINRELKYKTLSEFRKGRCLFYQSMEICPDGEIGFSSYLINSKNSEKYIIGNIGGSIWKKFENCQFKRGAKECQGCFSSYFDLSTEKSSEKVLSVRDLVSIEAAMNFEKKSSQDKIFSSYVADAKRHICF